MTTHFGTGIDKIFIHSTVMALSSPCLQLMSRESVFFLAAWNGFQKLFSFSSFWYNHCKINHIHIWLDCYIYCFHTDLRQWVNASRQPSHLHIKARLDSKMKCLKLLDDCLYLFWCVCVCVRTYMCLRMLGQAFFMFAFISQYGKGTDKHILKIAIWVKYEMKHK